MPRHIGVGDAQGRQIQRTTAAPPAGGRSGEAPHPRADPLRGAGQAGGLRLIPQEARRATAPVDSRAPRATRRANGGPCWLSLASRDHLAAKEF